MSDLASDPIPKPRRTWRFHVGAISFGLAWVLPVVGLLTSLLGLPGNWSSLLTSALVVWLPNLLGVLAVILLSKDDLKSLNSRVMKWLKFQLLPESALRYNLALILMVASSVAQWLGIYLSPGVAVDRETIQQIRIVLDLIFLTGLVLGGEQFWEKLKRLFTYDDPARIAGQPQISGR